jgi:D-glycero-D-manno-heptose 1,7-bisphosphate phosphatase
VKRKQVGIFFDRDGTINTEIDFLRKPEELKLIPKAVDAIREANDSGLKVFIITNQSGIARGFLTENDLAVVHKRLVELLKKQHAHVDGIYYCPHHPEYGKPPYNVACQCRKPNIGMLKKAEIEFNLDLKNSFVVGDRCVDAKAGKKAGCTTFLVLTGYGVTEQNECAVNAEVDYVVDDAYDAWLQIKGILNHQNVPAA